MTVEIELQLKLISELREINKTLKSIAGHMDFMTYQTAKYNDDLDEDQTETSINSLMKLQKKLDNKYGK